MPDLKKNGAPQVKVLEVTELAGDECNSKNICETILRVMGSRNLNIMDMVCITTDGASVMTGVRGGVTSLLKLKNEHLVSIHCIAHRLALASGQAADKVPYLKRYQAMINTIFKYFHYSPKHLSRLKKIQSVYEMATRKFQQTFHTRWLSFEGAVDAIIINYGALVTCLEADVAELDDAIARGILSFITDYQFLAVSYFLSDVLGNLAILSKVYQKKDLDLAHFNSVTKSTVSVLEQMKISPGPNLRSFFSMLPDNYCDGFEFGSDCVKYKIKCSPKSVSAFDDIKSKYLHNLLDNLAQRFTDNGLISCFGILNPRNLPSVDCDTFDAYGVEEIISLGKHYGSNDCTHSKLLVDDVSLMIEWPQFKCLLSDRFRSQTFSDMCSSVLANTDFAYTFPNISKLLRIAIVMPVSSADCERGFSRYNLVKTALRNRLKPESVNILLTLTIDTPSIENMDTFDFERAFQFWAVQKHRQVGKKDN